MKRALILLLLLLSGQGAAQTLPGLTRIDLPRFRIAHTERGAAAAVVLSKTLEHERDEIARKLGRDFDSPTDVLVGEADELAAIAPAGAQPPAWAAGMALIGPNALLLNAAAVRGERGRPLVRHELAHLALGRLGPGRFPRWFQEGFAMMVAGEWTMATYAATYRASLSQWAIPLSALETSFPDGFADAEIAYAESFSFVTYLNDQGGDEKLRALIAKVAGGAGMAESLAETYGRSLNDLESAWRKRMGSRYSWLGLLSGTGALWGFASALLLIAYFRLRRKKRLRLEEMALEEAAEAAALRIAAAEQAQATPGDSTPGPGDGAIH